MNDHAPLKFNKMVVRPTVPWYNDELRSSKRSIRKSERKWRRTKLETDFIDFKRRKNRVTYMKVQARRK